MELFMKDNKNNSDKVFSKTSINWYPGHMEKTRKQIAEDLKLVDIVIELLDARIPISSQNPEIAKIVNKKKKIIVLNKCDLSDENVNNQWIEYFKQKGISAVLTDSNSGNGINKCIKQVEDIMKEDLEILAQKGRIGRKTRAMILGIPNVGKSSFINRISKKTSAGVANKPGVTRMKQWIRINEKLELLDTPGVLWPKFESEEVALNLAFTGTIKDDVIDREEVAFYFIKWILDSKYRQNLCQRYKIQEYEIEDILEQAQDENTNIYEIFLLIGKKRGAIISGGKIDEQKTARIILDDFRNTRIGKISLEKPNL